MNQYFEVPILTSLCQNKFAMCNDETWVITSVEKMEKSQRKNFRAFCRNHIHKQNGWKAT